MKKVFGILSILIVLLSGTTIRYSAHYCQGDFIASRLSLAGKNASCGMTDESRNNKDLQFSGLMCENEISSYTFSDNYVYSPQVQDPGNHLQDIELPQVITPVINLIPDLTEFKVLPPGLPGQLKVESEVLCIFRI